MATFEKGISPETSASIPRTKINDANDLYPDRAATPSSGGGVGGPGTYPIRNTATFVQRLDNDIVPKTSADMNALFTWEPGDNVDGDHANAHPGMKRYREDMTKAWGAEHAYKHVWVDTLRPIQPQLNNIKKRGRKSRSR